MNQTVSVQDLPGVSGQVLPPSSWMEISQERVNGFADATNDHQFIHVDQARAAATPFGGTIAHGFLTLSLLSHLVMENFIRVEGTQMALNYGLDRVRFIHPVAVGSRIRSQQKIVDAQDKGGGRWVLKTEVTVEIEGVAKPAMLAEFLMMIITAPQSEGAR